jgi:hypothetical protein
LSILTTWVLPVIALISNLPFENGHHQLHGKKAGSSGTRHGRGSSKRQTSSKTFENLVRRLRRSDANFVRRTNFFEPFVNWIGSPQTALATILCNIHLLHRATTIVKDKEREAMKQEELDSKKKNDHMLAIRNVLFVVCCVGQYEFLSPDDGDKKDVESQWKTKIEDREKRKNRALLLGLLLPLCDPSESCPPGLLELMLESRIVGESAIEWESSKMKQSIASTKLLLTLLSHQLHLLRRRGMYPLTISTVWFFAAFAIGVYQSFRQFGNYTVAHSLAVGLLLSWLPVLVLMSVADRNPNGVERCTV